MKCSQIGALALTVVLALVLQACGPSGGKAVIVGSKIDTEGSLLAQIIIQTLKAERIPVEDKSGTGTTAIVRKALIEGQIDLYPEYTGNGAYFFNEAESPVWKDAAAAWGRVAELDLAANGLVWLQPAPANNTWAIAIPRTLARAEGITSLSDFAAWVNRGGTVKLMGSEEFITSPAALPSFQEVYGFTLAPDQLVSVASGDTAQTEKAAAQGTDGVNAAMAYGTDGALAALDLVVLADPAGAQPVYEPAVVVRQDALAARPGLVALLEPVFQDLDLETLQALNGAIVIEGRPAADVAAEWLGSR